MYLNVGKVEEVKKITSQALLHETSLTSQQPNNYRIYFMMSCESHA